MMVLSDKQSGSVAQDQPAMISYLRDFITPFLTIRHLSATLQDTMGIISKQFFIAGINMS